MGLNGLIDLLIFELKRMKIHLETPDDIHNIVVLSTLHQIADVLCGEEKIIVLDFINKRLEENR